MPKQEMSNLDYHYLQRELQSLVDARLTKVHELRPGVFRFQFHSSGQGRADLLVELGVRAHLTRRIEEAPEQPTHFAMLLRSKLGNARLKAVQQLEFDRLLSLLFDTKHGLRSILFELLPGGNVLLLDSQNTIMAVHTPKSFETRSLKRGAPYQPPPARGKLPSEITPEDLEALEGKLRPTLSKLVRLPPFYLEEVCARAGVDPKGKAELFPAARESLVHEFHSLLEQTPSPRVYRSENEPVAFAPFELRKLELPAEQFDSFSEALDNYYSHGLAAIAPVARPADKARTRVEKALEEQKKMIGKFEEQAAEMQAVGEKLFRQSTLVERALEIARKLKAEPVETVQEVILRETGLRVKVQKGELELELGN